MGAYKNKKILFMGDSITALGVWVKYFNEIMQPQKYINIAVSSATWSDNADTVYDGNPLFNGSDMNQNNTLCNQIEKLLRGKDSKNKNYTYNSDYDDFDIIVVSAGTNDCGIEKTDNIEKEIYGQFFDENGDLLSLEKVDCKTMAGAMRYSYEKLRHMYPDAVICYCSPIQGAEDIRPYSSIKLKRDYISSFCEHISDVKFIDTFECGICGAYEKLQHSGLNLADGLHPNDSGAKKIAFFNARSIKEYYL